MPDLFFSQALLYGGWARDVLVSVHPTGAISDVRIDAEPGAAARVAGIAVPGVPNAHSHAFQRAIAGLTEGGSPSGDTFWSWRDRMYAFLERLTPDDVEAIAAQLYVELLRHGYTTVAEFHYLRNDPDGAPYADPTEMGRRVLAAAETAGIGLTLLPTLYRASDFGGTLATEGQRRFVATVDEILQDIQSLGAAAAASKNVRMGLALHSLRAVPPEDLTAAIDGLDSDGPRLPVHIHVAEQTAEVEACLEWCGQRPVEWLLEHAPVDSRWCLVHATHMTSEEMDALIDRTAVVCVCPTTEANLGDGIFPLQEFESGFGRWAIGSDSHVSVGPAAELRLLEYAQRLTRRERNVARAYEGHSTGRSLLENAWRSGADACARAVGSIRIGHRADIVVLDGDHPALVGRTEDEILDSWIFSGEDTPVRDVMVGGAWVIRDGRHEREEEVAARYRETVVGLVG